MNLTLEDIKDDIRLTVFLALAEDLALETNYLTQIVSNPNFSLKDVAGDITAELIPKEKTDTAKIITREACIFCGKAWLEETFKQLGELEAVEWHVEEGQQLKPDDTIVTLKGSSRMLLTGERTALNFIQLLSAVATKANHYAALVEGTHTKLLDTRKTLPGLRTAQKYAVTIGGCHNHRIGLFDAFLIKENHVAASGSIQQAITTARTNHPNKKVEVEVESLEELKLAIEAKADIVMLDNFSEAMLAEAMTLKRGRTLYELSGNLEQEDITRFAKLGVDFMSFGGLTKHVQAVDLSMRIVN